MKRFISISLFILAAAAKALACSGPDTHNWYLFHVMEDRNFSSMVQRQFNDNWAAYIGDSDNYYWFDADALKAVARRKGDALMVSYLQQLERYLDIAELVENESWDYPTKEELARRRRTLTDIRQYALDNIDSRLRSQHALLAMRCNMQMGEHEMNVALWEQKACQMINSAYRDMMRNIYAGALLKTGRTDEATQIFIEQGDAASLYTYYYDKRSFDDIARVYADNPDSPALPFLLQDFASNAQEAVDALDEYRNWPGKLFINDVAREESQKMQQLCQRAVSDGKTGEPALWKSLEAWLLHLDGDGPKALKAIGEAMKLKGSEATMDNARVLNLYLTAEAGKPTDEFMARELAWLEQRANETRTDPEWYEDHFTHVFDRLAHQVVVDRYMRDGRPDVAIAFMAACDEMAARFYEEHAIGGSSDEFNYDYSTNLFLLLDSTDTDSAERYLQFVNADSHQSALDKWLAAHIGHDEVFLHELIGTKYLRQGEWQKAVAHLSRVPLSFVRKMNIADYMAQRSYTVEPWLRRQRFRNSHRADSAELLTNQKLDFAREMLTAEQRYGQAKGADRLQKAYDLAVRYYQASRFGDAWYLTEYGKSSYCGPDEPLPAFVDKARSLLREAAEAADFALRERAIFALAFAPYDTWHTFEWDDDAGDIVAKPITTRPEYAAMNRLADFARKNAAELSPYVTRCDILKQFMKQQ